MRKSLIFILFVFIAQLIFSQKPSFEIDHLSETFIINAVSYQIEKVESVEDVQISPLKKDGIVKIIYTEHKCCIDYCVNEEIKNTCVFYDATLTQIENDNGSIAIVLYDRFGRNLCSIMLMTEHSVFCIYNNIMFY